MLTMFWMVSLRKQQEYQFQQGWGAHSVCCVLWWSVYCYRKRQSWENSRNTSSSRAGGHAVTSSWYKPLTWTKKRHPAQVSRHKPRRTKKVGPCTISTQQHIYTIIRVPASQGKQWYWWKVIPDRETTGNLKTLGKHREFENLNR